MTSAHWASLSTKIAVEAPRLSASMPTAPLPASWTFLLAMPSLPKGAHGRKELDVFGTFCPVPKEEVAELCREILVRMIPAVLEEDLDSFGAAVNRVQELGFKKVEVGLQHPLVPRKLLPRSSLS